MTNLVMVTPVLVNTTNGKNAERKSLCGKTDSYGTQFKAEIYTNYTDGMTYPQARYWQENSQGVIQDDTIYWFEMPTPPGETEPVRLDSLVMTIAGHDVHLRASGHGATDEEPPHLRNQYDFELVFLGVYNPGRAGGEPEGAETFIPQGGTDVAGVTKAEVQGIVDTAVAGLIAQFGPEGIRTALANKTKDAMRDLFVDKPPDGSREKIFQDRFFNYIKNANAGVQANIVKGQDEWGQDMHRAFIAMIKEALHP